jgi:hypothetical protein
MCVNILAHLHVFDNQTLSSCQIEFKSSDLFVGTNRQDHIHIFLLNLFLYNCSYNECFDWKCVGLVSALTFLSIEFYIFW